MLLPIIAYGHPVLKRKAEVINKDYPKLLELIDNMFETMYNANGVGIAAPQIGLSVRLFIVDTNPFSEDESLSDEDRSELKSFKKIFINPKILDQNGDEWSFEEGCLSIPNIRESVLRQESIKIQYFDENFTQHIESYDGLLARVIQHEYDHIEGILFTDKLSSFKKQLLKKKLLKISSGKLSFDYEMQFFKSSKKR